MYFGGNAVKDKRAQGVFVVLTTIYINITCHLSVALDWLEQHFSVTDDSMFMLTLMITNISFRRPCG